MKTHFILILFLMGITYNSYSQKVIEREIDANSILVIEINSDIIFNITITSEKISKIKIRTSIEGENFENILLSIKEIEGRLSITPEFTPFFETKNDKLAAHKLLAIEMEIVMPVNIELEINSNLASVKTTGKFKSIKALLGTGNCTLNDFSGDAVIKTKQGFINVFADDSVKGIALSRKGTVINELNNKGKYSIEAESFKGDISLFLIE